MTKIQINLLPIELRKETIVHKRYGILNKISIAVVVLMVIITTGVLAYRFIQTQKSNEVNSQITDAKEKISSLKKQEELIFVLKSRLDKINYALSQESIHTQAFNLITALTPNEVRINSLSTDKTGKVLLAGQTDDLTSLKALFDNLTDPKKNEGKITTTFVESLNKNSSGIRFELAIQLDSTGGKIPLVPKS